jgi:uncharacterized membrane protein YjjB (DUF3815 family)
VQLLAARVRALDVVLPVLVAFAVSFVAYEFVADWFDASPTDVLIPPLVTFLPGAALTIGTVELATGSMVSGSSRLMYGSARLLLLAAGVAAGAEVAGGVTSGTATGSDFGWWAPWLGLLVFGVGHYVQSPAPPGSLGWLLLILAVAYGAQVGGAALWGSVAAGFTGAIVVPPLARWVETRRDGPPGLVSFLPAFWMLVPGALGLAGVTEIVVADGVTGLADLVDTLLSVLSIALGVLVGTSLTLPRVLTRARSA